MKRLLLVLAAVVAVLAVLLWQRQSAPPELPFAKAERQRLESTLLTNGKVEPVEWAAARSQREGLVARITVTRGTQVRADQVLAELDGGTASADLASAEARAAQAKADLAVAERGRPAEITEIENGLERARKDLADAERDFAAIKRLVEKNAAPKQDLRDLEDRAARARLQIESLIRRRAALPAPADADAARARLRDAQAAADLARRRLAQAQVRSPIDGVVYQLDARNGDWLQA
nr:biotin/lipoyl-binding protein [Bryobacter sp.]